MNGLGNQHLALEHYRFHVIEQWPDGPRKTAGLAAARSTLESLGRADSESTPFVCTICARAHLVPSDAAEMR